MLIIDHKLKILEILYRANPRISAKQAAEDLSFIENAIIQISQKLPDGTQSTTSTSTP